MSEAHKYDILGYGVAAVDEMIELEELPPPDVKVDVRSHRTLCGGICVNALAAAAKLGMRCHYVGTLGDNELSRIIREGMTDAGITFPTGIRHPSAGPSHAFILVDRSAGTRTILMNKARVREMTEEEIPEDVIGAARAIYVDAWRLDVGLHVVRTARRLGVHVLADFEEYEPERVRPLLPYVDHLILPLQYARKLGGNRTAEELVLSLHDGARPCTAVTIGAEGSWFMSGSETQAHRQRAFEVDVVDTTGCGDAFHGAYIAAYLSGRDVASSIRYASAAAAISARAIGAQTGLPTDEEVRAVLESSGVRC